MVFSVFAVSEEFTVSRVSLTGESDQRVEHGHRVAGKSVAGRTHVPQGLTDERRKGPIAFAPRPEYVDHFRNAVVVLERFPVVLVGRHVDQHAAAHDQQLLVAAAVQTVGHRQQPCKSLTRDNFGLVKNELSKSIHNTRLNKLIKKFLQYQNNITLFRMTICIL